MKNKKLRNALTGALLILVLLFTVCLVYVQDYYRADAVAVAALESDANITVDELSDGSIAFVPDDPKAGIIFYPGGKVEESAYAPLMQACAEKGFLCVLIKMPLRLAVLEPNAADGIQEQYGDLSQWYMAGHSLGGSMAASYIAEHKEEYAGLILLASYSTADLTDTDLRVLSIYGSEDGVLNREKYQSNYEKLPANTTEQVIEGGCHAGFAEYGEQEGDGAPTITYAQQIEETAEIISSWASHS